MKLPLGSEPIRTLLLPIALGAFVAAAQAFIAGADTRGIITAVLGALIVAGQELGRKLVTPVPQPTGGEAGQGELGWLVRLLVIVVLIVLLAWLVAALLPGDADAAKAVAQVARSSWS